jgi:hypothetical protein
MKNKKAQEMSTGAIALIILAVIVLVVLVLGFSLGWNKILPFLSSNNVESIHTACTAACTTGSTYDFCTVMRNVKDENKNKFKETCNHLATGSVSIPNEADPTNPTVINTAGYEISSCPSITCPAA